MISNFENDCLSPLKLDHLPHKIGHGQHRWTVSGIQHRVQSVESEFDVNSIFILFSVIIIIIITLVQEDYISVMNASLTYGPRLQR